MKTQRVLIGLTFLNLFLLALSLSRFSTAAADDTPSVLRGSGLEIVDGQGRVRASITLLPPDPTAKMPDGSTGYPETVLLRLITSEGRPNVKLGAGENGAGLLIAGEDEPAYVQVLATGPTTAIRLGDKAGKERIIRP